MTINEERIHRTEGALVDYLEMNNSYRAIVDLLSYLHHYCEAMDFTFDECLRIAKTHYENEVNERRASQ